jgi:hypothetical protein
VHRRQHDERRRHDASRTPRPEREHPCTTAPAGVAQQVRRDQQAGDREEHVDADEPSRRHRRPRVKHQHERDDDRAQTLDLEPHRHAALLGGETGIGKTSTAAAIARIAHEDPSDLCRGDRGVPGHQRTIGNDLRTPQPGYGFPGLQPGDRWCVTAPNWLRAYQDGSPLADAVRAAQDQGDIDSEADADAVADPLLAISRGIDVLGHGGMPRQRLERAVEAALTAFAA